MLLAAAAAAAAPQAIAEARDLAARAKTLQLEAGTALSRGDRDAWADMSADAVKMLRDAARLYREGGVLGSGDPALIAEYANVLELSRDYDLAAEAWAQLIDIQPESAEWRLKHGTALMEVGPLHRRRAKESLEQALEMAPDSAVGADAAAGLGDLYWDAAHYDLAAEYSGRAYAHEPGNIVSATNLAAAQIRRGQVAEAEQVLASLRSFRGDEFARSQAKISQALSDFDQSRGWFEDTAANHLAYARLLARVGRQADAVLALRRAAMLAPDNVAVFNFLGSVLRQMNDAQGARDAFEQSLKVNPDQPAVRESLAALD